MKIAVCGKGGTGKSTVVALFAGEFKKAGMRVTVIDSDESNSGLYWMLGLEKQPRPLMDFVGGKKDIQGKMIARFRDGQPEPEMSILLQDTIPVQDVPEDYRVEEDKTRLIAIGKIKQSFEGCACPMGVLSREFLKKLRLDGNEIAIVDMEAGIEHFGRGVEKSVDAVVAVIEPSLESINLAEKIVDLTSGAGANFAGVVMNKVSSGKTYETMRAELEKRRLPVLGQIVFSEEIVKACLQGQPIEPAHSGGQAMKIIAKLQPVLGFEKIPTSEYKEGNRNDR
ncbi:MAG: ATP-binding protein [Deltaproteobacteria bacterium]|nr:ATP-binding protein [Deltaproteobacteria bacterium]